jgi:hypothetical protein
VRSIAIRGDCLHLAILGLEALWKFDLVAGHHMPPVNFFHAPIPCFAT